MFNRNTSKIFGVAIALSFLLAGIGAVGLVAAEPIDSGSIDATNETESVYADVVAVSDYNGSAAPNVTVVVEGLPAGTDAGNGTELLNETRTLAAGSTESFDYALTDTDRSDYDRIEISIDSSGDGSLIASTDWGSLERISGGGGGLLGGGFGGISLPVILGVLVIGYVVMGRD